MTLLRATFLGLALWGGVCAILPQSVLFVVLMILGTIGMILVCILCMMFVLEWLEKRYG